MLWILGTYQFLLFVLCRFWGNWNVDSLNFFPLTSEIKLWVTTFSVSSHLFPYYAQQTLNIDRHHSKHQGSGIESSGRVRLMCSFSLKAKQNHKLFFACGHHTSKDSFSCISKRWVHFYEYVNWTYQIKSGRICDMSCNAPKVFNVWIKCYQYIGYRLLSLHKSHTSNWILVISLKYIFQVKKSLHQLLIHK